MGDQRPTSQAMRWILTVAALFASLTLLAGAALGAYAIDTNQRLTCRDEGSLPW